MSQSSRIVIGLVVLAAALSMGAASNARAATAAGITRIISPTSNQVVGNGDVRVVLESRAGLGSLQVFINGYNVKRYFRRVAGRYQADLRRGQGLWPGVDDLIVVTGAGTDLDSVTFIVAKEVPNLLELTAFRIDGPQAPVLVGARAAPGTTLEAWVNGHRDDAAFQPETGLYVGRLGANDWLRAGRNRLTLLAYRASDDELSARYTVRTKTFGLERGRLTASAGRDLIVNGGDFVRLDSTATDLGEKVAGRVSWRWTITHRPQGRAPTLTAPTSDSPGFEAGVPGTYQIKTTTTAADGATSADTVTVTVRADVPPIGARLDTVADDRGTIAFDGKALPNTTPSCDPGSLRVGCSTFASYAVFNRVTLQLVESGNVRTDTAGIASLLALASKYNAAPSYLMVVNMSGPFPQAGYANVRKLFDVLGAPTISDADFQRIATDVSPVSIVGVPGSPAGSAFVSNPNAGCVGPCNGPRASASMSGYVRLNTRSTTGFFEFVFTDQVEFNTDASTAASEISVKVGDATYAHAVPADGSSGFFLVRLNSRTLALDRTFFYVTNKPDGSEDPAEAKRLADDLTVASAGSQGEQLVLLQSFGRPKGTSAGWLAAAAAIGKLGGTAQVFAQLNQKTPDEPHEGRYAFVSRAAMDTSAAESSQALTGREGDGKLHGLLGRGRDNRYQPLAADPSGTINFDLVRIVNRPSPPGGGFPVFTPGEAAAATYLGRNPDIIGVCDPQAPTCDVRKAYYENDVGTDWSNILTRLQGNATTTDCAKASEEAGSGFTAADCESARRELEKEIGRRNTVAAYFGPKGLQAPFGTAAVAALVDVAKIAEEIRQAVQPPAANTAVSRALTLISFVVRLGGLAGPVCRPCGSVASGLGAAFGLAAYLTNQNGSPDLVGPQITTKAVELGSILFERYQAASDYFTTEAKIIMSDWSKMSEVAAVATSSPQWKLGDVATTAETIRLATKQAIYQALIPVAYPVLYDLGTGITDARNWLCRSVPAFLYDKRLFQNTGPGAQMIWKMTDAPYVGQSHLIAVGGRHTVGSLHRAFVPAPPDTLTAALFRDPSSPQGGIGLYKLQLFSPQNFQLFPKVLQQTTPKNKSNGYWTCQSMPNPPGNSG